MSKLLHMDSDISEQVLVDSEDETEAGGVDSADEPEVGGVGNVRTTSLGH